MTNETKMMDKETEIKILLDRALCKIDRISVPPSHVGGSEYDRGRVDEAKSCVKKAMTKLSELMDLCLSTAKEE